MKRIVTKYDVPLGSILLDVVGRILDVVYRLVLLSDQDAHLRSYVRREPWGVIRGGNSHH